MSAPLDLRLVDLTPPRITGGHAGPLRDALRLRLDIPDARVFAPYEHDSGPVGRTARLRVGIRTYAKALRMTSGGDTAVLVVPNPLPIDFFSCAVALMILPLRKHRAACLMTVYRAPDGYVAGKNAMVGRIILTVVRVLASLRVISFASDSEMVVNAWHGLAPRSTGSVIVAAPLNPIETDYGTSQTVGTDTRRQVFGLLGHMHPDKRIDRYGPMTVSLLSELPESSVVIQLSSDDDRAKAASRRLKDQFGDEPRVRFIEGHISDEDFVALLHDVQVALLPYDVSRYGDGASGILVDALDFGAVAVSTRLPWAVSRFGEDARVVWLEDVESDVEFVAAAEEAVRRIDRVPASAPGEREKEFVSKWLGAIVLAAEHSRTCEFGGQ